MARKNIRIDVPKNIEELTEAATTMLTRNDGVAPALPNANPVMLDLAARLGVTITITATTPPTTSPPPPGTNLIPTNLLAPLRTIYPQLARDVMTLKTLNEVAEALSTSVVNRLGIAEGQTLESVNTVRAIFSRVTPVLKSMLVGNENEIATYGVGVALRTRSSGGTPPPTPPPPPGP